MLDLMRKKAQSLVIQVIVGLIALVFVFWGVGGGGAGRNTMAVVDDEEITIQAFQKAYDQTVNRYRNQFGEAVSSKLLQQLGVKQQVLRQLVQQTLLRHGAREMGLDVTDREVQKTIRNMAAFKEKGIFSMKRYETILSGSRLTPGLFESSVRSDLLSAKVMDHLGRFVVVTPEEAKRRFLYEQEAVTVEYAVLSPDDFKKQVAVDDKALADFFNSRKEAYKTEPLVDVQYLFFPFEKDKATVSDEKIREYYDANRKRFVVPEQRRARHILLKVADTAPVEVLKNKKAQAEKIRELALAGDDFAELAKKYSEGPSAARGGDLGFFAKGRMVKEFNDTVFSMITGEVSQVVRTRFGFHIIKLEEVRAGTTRPLEAVREEIKKELTAKKARDASFATANKAYEKMVLAGSLEKYAGSANLPLKRSGLIGRLPQGGKKGQDPVVDEPAFRAAALGLAKGELSSLVDLPSGYAILYAINKVAPTVPDLQTVRARVEKDFIAEKALDAAEKEAEKWLAELRKTKNPKAFAEQVAARKLTLEEAGPFARTKRPDGVPAEMINAARRLEAGQIYPSAAVVQGDKVYVYRLKNRTVAKADKDPMQDEAFVKRLTEEKRQRLLSSWLDFLEKRADITINQELLNS